MSDGDPSVDLEDVVEFADSRVIDQLNEEGKLSDAEADAARIWIKQLLSPESLTAREEGILFLTALENSDEFNEMAKEFEEEVGE